MGSHGSGILGVWTPVIFEKLFFLNLCNHLKVVARVKGNRSVKSEMGDTKRNSWVRGDGWLTEINRSGLTTNKTVSAVRRKHKLYLRHKYKCSLCLSANQRPAWLSQSQSTLGATKWVTVQFLRWNGYYGSVYRIEIVVFKYKVTSIN